MTTTLVIPPEELDTEELRVEGPVYRHLFRARRLRVDDEIRLVDGNGRARYAIAARIDAKSATLRLGETAPSNEPPRLLSLIAPVPKASRLSWMVEKVTEIGASAIHLIHTERAPRQTGSPTLDRLRRVARSAVEQSHRSLVPEISGVHRFSDVRDLLEPTQERYFLDPGSESGVLGAGRTAVALLVGPEGGWTDSEKTALMAWGCRPWGLGPTVLRVETAAAVGSAGLLIEGFLR